MGIIFDFDGSDHIEENDINNIINFRLGYNPLLDWMFKCTEPSKPDILRFRRLMIFMHYLTKTVSEYGIHSSFSGYSYLIDAICIFYYFDTNDLKLNNDVYPIIARKYHIRGIGNVEHNIRNAILDAYNRCQSSPGSNNMKFFDRKPGNKDFIIHVTDLMRIRMAKEFCSEQA